MSQNHHFTVVIFILFGLVLFACQEPVETVVIPTATLIELPTSTPKQESRSTPVPPTETNMPAATISQTNTSSPPTEIPTIESTLILTPSSTPTVLPTAVPQELILEQFPLEVGLTRVYQVTFVYAVKSIPETMSWETDSWTGLVTERIVSQREEYKSLIFEAEISGEPMYFNGDEVVFEDRIIEYKVTTDGIVRNGIKILQFPIETGTKWLAFDDDYGYTDSDWYRWVVDEVKDVITPAGYYSDCWSMSLYTRPDSNYASFCPGVGIATRSGFQHGAPQDERWQLYWMGES